MPVEEPSGSRPRAGWHAVSFPQHLLGSTSGSGTTPTADPAGVPRRTRRVAGSVRSRRTGIPIVAGSGQAAVPDLGIAGRGGGVGDGFLPPVLEALQEPLF